MIPIRLLNGTSIFVNAELLETVSSAPDTIITLTSGRKIVASTPPEEILKAVVRYRRRIHKGPRRTRRPGDDGPRHSLGATG